jgi:hypothetical protein
MCLQPLPEGMGAVLQVKVSWPRSRCCHRGQLHTAPRRHHCLFFNTQATQVVVAFARTSISFSLQDSRFSLFFSHSADLFCNNALFVCVLAVHVFAVSLLLCRLFHFCSAFDVAQSVDRALFGPDERPSCPVSSFPLCSCQSHLSLSLSHYSHSCAILQHSSFFIVITHTQFIRSSFKKPSEIE